MSKGTQTFSALEKVVLERQRQDLKWGPPEDLPKDRTPERWLAILMEEIGELSECVVEIGAAIEDGVTPDPIWASKLHKELVQSAGVAVSWLEWLDANAPD